MLETFIVSIVDNFAYFIILFALPFIYLCYRKLFTNEAPYSYWIKVHLALELHVQLCLLNLLHNKDNDPAYTGLPENKTQLYNHLDNWWNNLNPRTRNHLNNNILNANQKAMLFPTSGLVDTSLWDITLIMLVIRNCIPQLKPNGGWGNFAVNDQSKGANAIRARDFRNKVIHRGINNIDSKKKFEQLWNELNDILTELGYNNMKEFHELKIIWPFGVYVELITNILNKYKSWLQKEYETKLKDSIKKEIDAVNKIQSSLERRLRKCGKSICLYVSLEHTRLYI